MYVDPWKKPDHYRQDHKPEEEPAKVDRLHKIAFMAAHGFEGQDWHKLNTGERKLVAELELAGYLVRKTVPNGFVGKATVPMADGGPPPNYTEEELRLARELEGKEWVNLTAEETALAIKLQRINRLIGPTVHVRPDKGHGMCLVGAVVIPC